jgi:CRISPR/Cas system-associated exonuclease Cas4 (RecB family)
MALAHSYSSVKMFENCGKQYHEVRILKKFKSSPTEATMYGERVHKAFEEFVRDKKPLPENLEHYRSFVEPLAGLSGEIRCEEKLGIRADFSPCGFFDSDVWFRGVPDYLAINPARTVARVGDYKTGKSSRYADTGQLELMAAMVMAHYPTIEQVKGALIFVVAKDIIQANYTRAQLPEILSRWAGRASMIDSALDNGVWNARPGPLCGFCPVDECAHHRK